MHLRCVVLVIAHHNPAYEELRRAWDAHWRCHEHGALRNMRRYYLYNDPHQTEPVRVDDHDWKLTFPHEETYPAPGLLLKTLGALDHLAASGVTYDYLLRTNVSSLFDWPWMERYLRGLRPDRLVSGVPYMPHRMSGMCLLLSADLVRDIATHRDRLEMYRPDDEAVALYLLVRHSAAGVDALEYQSISSVTIRTPVDAFLVAAVGQAPHLRFHRGWGLSDDRALDRWNMLIVHWVRCYRWHAVLLLPTPMCAWYMCTAYIGVSSWRWRFKS